MTDKQHAFLLYKERVPQTEIARILGKSEQTITKWKISEKWDVILTETALSEQTIQDKASKLLRYQLDQLEKIMDSREESQLTPEERMFNKGQIDGIRDLYNITKSKEVEWSVYIRVIRELNKFLKDANLALAQQAGDYFNDFLNAKRKSE